MSQPPPSLQDAASRRPSGACPSGRSVTPVDYGVELTAVSGTPPPCPVSSSGATPEPVGIHTRSTLTLRYLDPSVERRYLAFAHENTLPRIVYFVFAGPAFLLMRIIGALIQTDRQQGMAQSHVIAAEVAINFMLIIAILLSVPSIARRCPAIISSRLTEANCALLAEHAVTFGAWYSRARAINLSRVSRYVMTEGGWVNVQLAISNSNPLAWYMAAVPPRLSTAAPWMVLLLGLQAGQIAEIGATGAADACGEAVVLFQTVVSVVMLRAWESASRRNFEARTALRAQARRGAALVLALESKVAVTTCADPNLGRPVRQSTDVVMVVRTAQTTIAHKKALIDMTDALLATVHGHLAPMRFGCSGNVVCIGFTGDGASAILAACALARTLQRWAAAQQYADDTDRPRVGIDTGEASIVKDAVSDWPPCAVGGSAERVGAGGDDTRKRTGSAGGGRGVHADADAEHGAGGTAHGVVSVGHGLERRRYPGGDSAEAGAACVDLAPGGEQQRGRLSRYPFQLEPFRSAPTSVARGASVFDGLLAADARLVTYRYHWAFGWLFKNPELESEYRAQECRGSARYMPAAASVALCVVVLAWLLSSGLGSMSAVTWATWSGALVTSAAMCATARPYALGQRRLVLLHVMLRLCIVLLGLSVKYNRDLLNPMALYFVHYAMPVANVCLLWLPSCLPMLLIWFFEMIWIAPFSPRETVAKHVGDTGKFELLVVLGSCVGGFAVALVLRARNRALFADRTAALRSAERWAAARVQLQKEFQRVVPAPVARRIVAAGTAACAGRRQSTVSTSSTFDYDFVVMCSATPRLTNQTTISRLPSLVFHTRRVTTSNYASIDRHFPRRRAERVDCGGRWLLVRVGPGRVPGQDR
jgi:hypothetical protein